LVSIWPSWFPFDFLSLQPFGFSLGFLLAFIFYLWLPSFSFGFLRWHLFSWFSSGLIVFNSIVQKLILPPTLDRLTSHWQLANFQFDVVTAVTTRHTRRQQRQSDSVHNPPATADGHYR
jgi:hypothetical protein